jgi:cell division protein ZapB
MALKASNRLTRIPLRPYSGGMISEFQELSDKIDQLAAMTQALRRENAQLRQANAALVVDNLGYQARLSEAAGRVEALLEQIPALVAESMASADTEDAQ